MTRAGARRMLVRRAPAASFPLRCLGGEGEDRRRREGVARGERGRGEGRLVGRVGEVLGLEGVAGTLAVGVTGDASERAGEEVAAVELDARLVGPDGQLAAATRIPGPGGEIEAVRTGRLRRLLVEYPVVVVALGDGQLALALGQRVVARRDVVRRAHVVDPRPDGVRGGEVERRARDGDTVRQVRQRDLRGVGRRVVVRVDLDQLVVSRASLRVLARQVEVAGVSEVDDRAQLGVVVVRRVVDLVLALVVQRVGDVNGELGGVAGAAVRAARAAGGA